MKEYLSDKINDLPASATLTMAAKARELKNKGVDIIGLSLGEPDFNTPEYIKDAAISAVKDNYNSYTPVDGYIELKQSISTKFSRDNNLKYNVSQIVVSTGAKQSIANAVQALVKPGEEVILLAPFWVSYSAIVLMAEGVPKIIASDINSNFKVSAKEIEKAITDKTKMIIINSPNNPSGSIFSKKELDEIATVLRKYPNIFILSDEIYEHINYGVDHVSFASLEGMYERTITVNGIAKAFAMTGWRIGYIGAPDWIAKACTKLQGQVTSGANCIAQKATVKALTESPKKINYMVEEFKERKKLIINLLSNIKGFKLNNPDGAFYVFPDISYYFGKEIDGEIINSASDFAMVVLEKAHVATVTGDAFGCPNNIRISYAASQESIIEAVSRINKLLN